MRNNFGGNMWPMRAAVDSILHKGTQGYFFDTDNKASEWSYNNGRVYLDTSMLAENKNIVSLHGKDKVAILINNQTASSGEEIGQETRAINACWLQDKQNQIINKLIHSFKHTT